MVAELPDFVTGLIDIARRGRSLGVHLLLATQRPAGVVSADIRANTNLRIALRVTNPDESADVIDTSDAAFIAKSTPGRCYVRSGASSPVAVQSARDRRPAAGRGTGRRDRAGGPAAVARARPAAAAAPAPGGDEESMATDLSALVDAIAAANAKLGLGQQRRPWLEPLPESSRCPSCTLGERPAAGGAAEVPPIPYGLIDLPGRQARAPLALDFTRAGHVAVGGRGAHRAVQPAAYPRRLGGDAGLPGRRAHLRDRLRHRRAAPGRRTCRTAARW